MKSDIARAPHLDSQRIVVKKRKKERKECALVVSKNNDPCPLAAQPVQAKALGFFIKKINTIKKINQVCRIRITAKQIY